MEKLHRLNTLINVAFSNVKRQCICLEVVSPCRSRSGGGGWFIRYEAKASERWKTQSTRRWLALPCSQPRPCSYPYQALTLLSPKCGFVTIPPTTFVAQQWATEWSARSPFVGVAVRRSVSPRRCGGHTAPTAPRTHSAHSLLPVSPLHSGLHHAAPYLFYTISSFPSVTVVLELGRQVKSIRSLGHNFQKVV